MSFHESSVVLSPDLVFWAIVTNEGSFYERKVDGNSKVKVEKAEYIAHISMLQRSCMVTELSKRAVLGGCARSSKTGHAHVRFVMRRCMYSPGSHTSRVARCRGCWHILDIFILSEPLPMRNALLELYMICTLKEEGIPCR